MPESHFNKANVYMQMNKAEGQVLNLLKPVNAKFWKGVGDRMISNVND